MPSEKSTLCALFMDQMRTKKQNKNKEKTNKQTTTTTPTDKILKLPSQRYKP